MTAIYFFYVLWGKYLKKSLKLNDLGLDIIERKSMDNTILEVSMLKDKSKYKPALIISILSIISALLIALVGDILAVVGITFSILKRNDYDTKLSLVLSVIGLILAIANHVLGIMILNGTIQL